MNPLCTLRYSATHVDKHHMVYRLDAVDAYERKLVKQIEVASATRRGRPQQALRAAGRRSSNKRGVIQRQGRAGRADRQRRAAPGGDRAGRRQPGADDQARRSMPTAASARSASRRATSSWSCACPAASSSCKPGQAWGDVDALAVQREMIRRTIKEHLDKEKRLRPQGIKVLSLFFIDAVEKYRKYDADGNPVKGDYARIFEEEYRRLAKHPDYQTLFKEVDLTRAAEEVHDGYFSIDKKGGWTDTEENNQANRDNAERAYNLIMKEKEKLLSFETPLKFIFSHSALREGWDNPNVFQICTLRDMRTERERRQTIGRGLRLCVNQKGERLRGFEVNTLTVIATESYEQFAENLQKEIEEDTGIRFGIVETHQFAGDRRHGRGRQDGAAGRRAVEGALGAPEGSRATSTPRARCRTRCKKALKDGTLTRAGSLRRAAARRSPDVLRKLAGRLEIKNADERRQVRTRQAVLHSAEFKALWDRIKHKTTYRVQFDNEKLVESCIEALQERAADRQDAPAVAQGRPRHRQGGRGGDGDATAPRPVVLDEARHRAARPADRPAGQDPAHPPHHPAHPDRAAGGSMTSSATRSSSSSWPPRRSTAASAWPSWTASSTSGSATSTTTPRSCSSRRS